MIARLWAGRSAGIGPRWWACALCVMSLSGCGASMRAPTTTGGDAPVAARTGDANGAPYVLRRFFVPGDFSARREYYTGEMAADYPTDASIGEQLPPTARVSFHRLPNPGGPTVWQVEIAARGQRVDWYAYLSSRGGKTMLSALRTLAISPVVASAGGSGFRLALSADPAIKRFGLAHLTELNRVVAWFAQHPGTTDLQPSSGGAGAAALASLDFADATSMPGYGGDVFIAIAGVTDNVAGFAHVPSGGRVPVMDGREFIYLERIAPGWYAYKST